MPTTIVTDDHGGNPKRSLRTTPPAFAITAANPVHNPTDTTPART